MEIHAPHHPVMSLREFLVHMLVVTVGILIALGLEQTVETYHHHHIAQEARENILSEISDNKKELDKHLESFEKMQKDRADDVALLDQLIARKPMHEMKMELGYSGSSLNSASWTTASTIGALSYMDYPEVKRYAAVYKLQELYERLQNDEIRSVQAGLGMLNILDGGPDKATPEELRTVKHQILQSSASLTVLKQIATQLSAEYAKALQRH